MASVLQHGTRVPTDAASNDRVQTEGTTSDGGTLACIIISDCIAHCVYPIAAFLDQRKDLQLDR